MRILAVVDNPDQPSERFIHRELDALRQRGHIVTVWGCAGDGKNRASPTRTAEDQRRSRFSLIRTLFPPACRHPVATMRFAGSVLQLAEHTPPPDLIFAHFLSVTAWCGFLFSTVWNRPLVLSTHARDLFLPYPPAITAARRARRLLACTRMGRDRLRHLLPERDARIALVHHGVPADWQCHSRAEPVAPPRLFAAGRWVEKKGFNTLLDAMARLRTAHPSLTLTLAGDGPLRTSLEARRKHLGLEDVVSFPGFLAPEEIREHLDAATLFVAPSRVAADGDRDGIPNVILEAMARRVPVVACDAGGISELVADGQTGALVPSNEPYRLAGALDDLLHHPEKAETLAENAAQFQREHFDSEQNAAQLAALLEEAADR